MFPTDVWDYTLNPKEADAVYLKNANLQSWGFDSAHLEWSQVQME